MKRPLSILLVLALCLTMLPAALPANAAELSDLTYTITDGEVTITDCNTSAQGELVIPDTIEGYPVTAIGNSAFSRCYSLTCVTIPEGVTSIGNYAFKSCSSLTSVIIPKNVTSIGASAFSSCSALTSVTIAEGVTSIEEYAFRKCTSLTSVVIPSSITNINDYAFLNCSALKEIYFCGNAPTFNTPFNNVFALSIATPEPPVGRKIFSKK